MHAEIGSKWSQISKMKLLLGRTVSQIKNRFYQNLKGKDIEKIIYRADPSTENKRLKKQAEKDSLDFNECENLRKSLKIDLKDSMISSVTNCTSTESYQSSPKHEVSYS